MNSAPTFRFVAQPGSLAHRSRFLAGSLRRFAPAGSVLEACVPAGHDLDAATLAAFEAMGVVVRRFKPEIWRRHDYPIGNKVEAACLPASTPQTLLLDSDIVAIRPLRDGRARRRDSSACARSSARSGVRAPSTGPRSGGSSRPASVSPTARPCSATSRSEARPGSASRCSIPGSSCFRTAATWPGGFASLRWRRSNCADLPDAVKRPFADQLALACLALEHPECVTVLPEHWNCPIERPAGTGEPVALFRLHAAGPDQHRPGSSSTRCRRSSLRRASTCSANGRNAIYGSSARAGGALLGSRRSGRPPYPARFSAARARLCARYQPARARPRPSTSR